MFFFLLSIKKNPPERIAISERLTKDIVELLLSKYTNIFFKKSNLTI